jgi:hypothetical protein
LPARKKRRPDARLGRRFLFFRIFFAKIARAGHLAIPKWQNLVALIVNSSILKIIIFFRQNKILKDCETTTIVSKYSIIAL